MKLRNFYPNMFHMSRRTRQREGMYTKGGRRERKRDRQREGKRENQCSAILMGVVRQAINTSAENSALWGRV